LFPGPTCPGTPGTTRCPEPLCTRQAFPRVPGCLASRQQALPYLPRSYGLMRQSSTLPSPLGYPLTPGLGRLLPAPAGRRTFPTLSLRICLCVPGPLPRRLPWCICPFLPTGQRPSRHEDPVGAQQPPYSGNFRMAPFRGCSHSLMFKPADLLATQVAPTAVPLGTGQLWLLRPRLFRFVPSPNRGYANRLNRATDGRGTFTLQDSQPCRLLP